MHRTPLLQELESYLHKYPGEGPVVKRFQDFITREESCFSRSLSKGHITGSAWLMDLDGGRVLLTHHKKLGKWLQLGGHADEESRILKVALKEAREESGIDLIDPVSTEIFDIDIHEIPARQAEPAHLHYDIRFLLKVKLTNRFVVSSESRDLAWVALANVSEYSQEPSLLRMVEKAKRHFSPGI